VSPYHIQGRDLIDSIEKAVYFDRETCRWVILGEAREVQRSKEWKLVLEALRAAGQEGLKVKEIMEETGVRPRNNLDVLLGRMVSEGAIERRKRGLYAVSDTAMAQGDSNS
jgi:predicted transcriptional regulator of viral defense system